MRYLGLITILILASPAVLADTKQSQPVLPGYYVLPSDNLRSGELTIKKRKSGRLEFSIDTSGANCHSCSASGIVKGNTGYVTDSRCEIDLQQNGASVEVSAIQDDCRIDICGMRASFEGLYVTIPDRCSRISQQVRRNEFLKLYQRHMYSEAVNKLSTLLVECEGFIGWGTIDDIRNDLAVAQLHSGSPSACLRTLSDTSVGEATNENELEGMPCDRESYIALAKKTWHNKALCERAISRQRQ